MEEILFKWVSQVGFPILVAVYLLVRIEPRINALTTCVQELVLIVRADTENTREVKNAIVNFTSSINDLRNEISKISGR
jgi:uncharacterized protein YegL